MGDDAIHFENLLIRISLGDVKLPDHGRPVALALAASHQRKRGSVKHKQSQQLKHLTTDAERNGD